MKHLGASTVSEMSFFVLSLSQHRKDDLAIFFFLNGSAVLLMFLVRVFKKCADILLVQI